MTKTKVNKLMKDAEKVEKIQLKIMQLMNELRDIEESNDWARYCGSNVVENTEIDETDFYEAHQKILYARRNIIENI